MTVFLFGLVLLGALLLVPLGLPGLWIMLGAAFVYNWLVPAAAIGWVPIVIGTVLALAAEVLEFTLSAKYATKYGGSKRAGWGALIGGIFGAFVGAPVPVVGSMLAAFAGSFVGALAFELTVPSATAATATRVARGALIGRVAAAAVKTGLGCAVAATLLVGAGLGG